LQADSAEELMFCKRVPDNQPAVGGIEPHTRVVAQGLTPYCDQIVTTFSTRN